MNDETTPNELPKGLAQTIQRYLDGQIEEQEFAELQELMERSAEARKFYRSVANMDSNLREIAEESEPENVVPIGSPRRSVVAALSQAAAMFVLGAVLVYVTVGNKAGPEKVESGSVSAGFAGADSSDKAYEPTIATLTRAVGVEWGEGARNFRVGSGLPSGKLKFETGLLQIEFYSGAIVIIEGPAEFDLVDPMRAVCHFGKTRANVPESAHGFTITSSHVDVVDLGTEFALVVDKSGKGEVHVFDGEVEIHEKPGGEMLHLMSGNGVRFGEGSPEVLPLNEMGFVDFQRVSSLATAEADEHRARWLHYSEELKADPDVMLYFSFDETRDWVRQLRNVRKMTADPLHGAVVGCQWSQGRWIGKSALEFKRAGDRVRIQIPGKHDQFSLMAWVRIDGFDRDLNSLMLSDNWVAGGLHWQFTRKGELILGTKFDQGSGHYQTLPVLNQSHLGQWIQLAVSYDSKTKRVAHYLNGKVVWQGEMEHHFPVSVPRGELGNWKTDYPQQGTNIRNLNGRMDEFVVFSRSLSDSEMGNLFERGKPHS